VYPWCKKFAEYLRTTVTSSFIKVRSSIVILMPVCKCELAESTLRHRQQIRQCLMDKFGQTIGERC
jgi:hypothetical protein